MSRKRVPSGTSRSVTLTVRMKDVGGHIHQEEVEHTTDAYGNYPDFVAYMLELPAVTRTSLRAAGTLPPLQVQYALQDEHGATVDIRITYPPPLMETFLPRPPRGTGGE